MKFACFKGKVKVKLRGNKLDAITNIGKDIYDLQIYQSEITDTARISQQEYDSYSELDKKLNPELIEALVEKPGGEKEKHFYVEDIRNCIIYNYQFESFKRESASFGILTGDIVFQIEFRIKETIIVEVPEKERIIIPAGKIKVKRAAVASKPRLSGEYLPLGYLFDFLIGLLQIVVGLILLLAIMFALRDVWKPALLIGGIIAAMWFIGYFGKLLFKIVGTLISWVIFLLIFGFAITWLSQRENTWTTTKTEEKKYEDIVDNDSIIYQEEKKLTGTDSLQTDSLRADSIQTELIYNSLSWSDFQQHHYSFDYQLTVDDFKHARQNRADYLGYSWTAIYDNLYQNDNQLLKGIYQKYDSLKTGLNSIDFARLIVSSIQEIPYTWILPESCFDAANKEEMERSGYACLGNVKKYGVQSPVEFMANQKGDCDTKTLILYSILRHFNYDVCILTSMVYEHALLGIKLPVNGKFKMHQGKKYYLWETTVKGLDIGQIPPSHTNMDFWEVSL